MHPRTGGGPARDPFGPARGAGFAALSRNMRIGDDIVQRHFALINPANFGMSIGALHLLIKFSGSRNPVSRRTGESTAGVSADAATAELQQYADKINAEGATEAVFRKYAEQRSDCGSFKQGGDLGLFNSGDMQKQFEDGTLATEVGKMSGIVLSDSGYHLIFRTR